MHQQVLLRRPAVKWVASMLGTVSLDVDAREEVGAVVGFLALVAHEPDAESAKAVPSVAEYLVGWRPSSSRSASGSCPS